MKDIAEDIFLLNPVIVTLDRTLPSGIYDTFVASR